MASDNIIFRELKTIYRFYNLESGDAKGLSQDRKTCRISYIYKYPLEKDKSRL